MNTNEQGSLGNRLSACGTEQRMGKTEEPEAAVGKLGTLTALPASLTIEWLPWWLRG